MALEQLAGQTTAYGLAMAELMFKKLQDEETIRRANLENWMNYLRQIEARRHAEAEAKRRRNQGLGLQLGAIAATAGLGALMAPASGGLTAAGGASDALLEGSLASGGTLGVGGTTAGALAPNGWTSVLAASGF